ncbi:MAG: hypothetical protein B6D61_14400, partial [Bacteroidetes bacterium 4484_249]
NGDLEISNGELILNGHLIDVSDNLFVYASLTMTNADDELWVDEMLKFESGATGNITDGLIKFRGLWSFASGTDVMIGPGNIATAIGTTNQNINNYDDNSCFGQLRLHQTNAGTVVSSGGSQPVRVSGDFFLNPDNILNLNGDDFIVNGSTFIYIDALIELENGSSFISDGDLDVYGGIHLISGDITVHSDFFVNYTGSVIIEEGNFIVDKQPDKGTPTIDGYFEMNGGLFDVTNDGLRFLINSSSLITGGEIRTALNFDANYPDTFQPTGGTVRITGPDFSSIVIDNTNYFHNLIIDKTGTTLMNTIQPILINNDLTVFSGTFNTGSNDITINGSVIIEAGGILDPDAGTIFVKGDWTNNHGTAGFEEGTAQVSFTGADNSYILTDETFYTLAVDKTGGMYTYLWASDGKTVNVFDLNINNCSFRLQGNSTLNITNNIIISENTNLYASSTENSYINIGGNWYNHNTTGYPVTYGFTKGLSTVTFNGTDDQYAESDNGMQDFYNLIIDKPANHFYPACDLTVENDVTINNGIWGNDVLNNEYTFNGDINLEAGGAFDDNSCLVYISGGGNRNLNNNSTNVPVFGEMHLNMNIVPPKDLPVFNLYSDLHCYSNIQVDSGCLSLNSNTIECLGNFAINEYGKVSANDQSTIAMGDGCSLGISGGELEMLGDEANNPLLTHLTGYYEFTIANQGMLSASNATFEYMDASGVNIYSTGSVYGTHALSKCTFQNGQPAGVLLQINNDQDLIISGANFPDNTWSGTFNVAKTVATGSLVFTNYTGNFAGPAYENDPYNRIDWGNNVAGIWTGASNHYWNNSANWQNNLKPTSADDVYIPAGTPNEPWVAIADQECNNITIENGASLRIYDEELTVHSDMLIYGELIMDNASGVLNAGDSYGDIISWEPGSTADVTAGTINVTGDWYFKMGANIQLGSNNTVVFYGINWSTIYCNMPNIKFGKLHINKSSNGHDYVKVPENNFLTVASECYILDGNLMLNDNVEMKVYDEIFVSNGGTLSAVGSAGNEVLVSGYPNHALFEIGSGGTISAEYAIFEFLDNMYIGSSAIVDPLHPFNNCTFREGTANGTLISINNNQSLTIDSANFPFNTWGGNHCISKTQNQGHITFTNVQGGFVGDNYENDPYDLIDWPGVVAGRWNGSVSSTWNNLANWDYYLKPGPDDEVIIPAGTPHNPVINYANQECKNINIEAGASLEIADKTLTVLDDLIIYGSLIMNHAQGALNVGDNAGDLIAWRPGSTANITAGTINVYGNWYFYSGIDASFGGGNTTVFHGNNFSTIYCYDDDASFGNMTIIKTSAPHNVVYVTAGHSVRVAEDFYLGDGVFELNEGSLLQVGNELYVDDGTTLKSLGTAGNNATITGNSNYCLLPASSFRLLHISGKSGRRNIIIG